MMPYPCDDIANYNGTDVADSSTCLAACRALDLECIVTATSTSCGSSFFQQTNVPRRCRCGPSGNETLLCEGTTTMPGDDDDDDSTSGAAAVATSFRMMPALLLMASLMMTMMMTMKV
eukprot:CAMPEP_0168739948 /NCGR_PEP_ID=MMETSP0724-20121128/11724_1 /TAXON_ID=265536 /ORGANISM="Amphiprora sp., Strain CCMP467" /LENGTH=117 /DNA_ID=CAMNT_0008787363 /DNA_START=76 /DNA_END=429 /DNA_ORIENTATION=+